MNILNFIQDEKFIDTVIDNHDAVEDNVRHFYVLVLKLSQSREEYVSTYIKAYKRVTLLYESEVLNYITTNSIDAIMLHSLYSIPIHLIPKITTTIPILWNGWGYDLYEKPYLAPLIPIRNLYLSHTQKLVKELQKLQRGKLKNYLAYMRDILVKKNIYVPSYIRKTKNAIKRINYFSGIIDLEYKLMTRRAEFKAQESVYVYGSFKPKYKISLASGSNILLGNSGNPTNNHLDLLKLLKDRGIEGFDIITPLSYGGPSSYIETICAEGKKLFGTRFKPLTSYMPYEDYINLINTCRILIVGIKRQQAMGNINMAISMGCKIFFLKDSILYKYYKDKGFIVFTIEDELTYENVINPLKENEYKYNIALQKELYSTKWNPERLKKIYSQFRNFKASLTSTDRRAQLGDS